MQVWKQPHGGGRFCTISQAHVNARSTPSAPTELSSDGLERLFGIGAPGDSKFDPQIIHGTDASKRMTLHDNKEVVFKAIKQAGATEQEQAIVFAIAMQVCLAELGHSHLRQLINIAEYFCLVSAYYKTL